MQLRLIISSLRHHRLTAFLLVMQVACTCAIVCNVVFMVVNRIERVTLPSGIAENQLSVIVSSDIRKRDNDLAQTAMDLAALRAIPGLKAVAVMSDSLPLDRSDSSSWICISKAEFDKALQSRRLGPGCVEPSIYNGGPGTLKTLGAQLTDGRDFLPDEYIKESNLAADVPPAMIITRSLAQRLYPGQNALGQSVYIYPGTPVRIVGIIKNLLRPNLRQPGLNYYSTLWPVQPASDVMYVLRSAPQDRQQILKAALAVLDKLNPDRIIWQKRTYQQIRHDYFQRDITMIGLLLASVGGLLFVTALGIAGLASFWVQQRTHQIGIRRAIGATRGNILRYFQLENFLIVSTGIMLGLILATGLNLILMQHYSLPRLPWTYLPAGAIALWLVGQLAVLGPALRAAQVPPVVATRSV
jgi:putative ABC transport system permease protein